MLSKTAVTEAIRRHGKAPLIYLGTALALASVGTATAAAAAPAPAASAHAVAAPAASAHAVATAPAAGRTAAGHAAAGPAATVRHSPARRASVQAGTAGTRRQVRAEEAKATPEHKTAAAPARKPATAAARKPATAADHKPATAADRQPAVAERKPAIVPLADRVLTGPVAGPQEWMPITPARWQNATTIVRQALARHMGVRSAVIAVATSMQEATLQNISYGDRDSLGLFQQRPSMGWGTPAQVTDPAYAAGAFLGALHAHQQADPSWASQPLWQNAQAVQNSGFPSAYAKWEAQAASLVKDITSR